MVTSDVTNCSVIEPDRIELEVFGSKIELKIKKLSNQTKS